MGDGSSGRQVPSRELAISGDVLRFVPADEAVGRAAFFKPYVEAVLDIGNSGETWGSILHKLRIGTMQLWEISGKRGICVTEVQDYPRYRQLLVFMVAGERAPEWLVQGQADLETYALRRGCDMMSFQGRPGWRRYCERLGYTGMQIVMQKDLRNGRVIQAADNGHEHGPVEGATTLSS
jgi:hypothetical protein